MIIAILLISGFLLYFVQRGIYRKYWDKGLSAELSFDGKNACEGETGTLYEVLMNRSYLPLPFVHAKFKIGSGIRFDDSENVSTSDLRYKNDIFSILFYQKITRTLRFTCIKRGYYPIEEAELLATDLFYREKFLRSFPQTASFYVYPKRINTSRLDQPLKKLIGDMTSRQFMYPDPFEFKGLRSYTVSDPMNTINWKASAKAGELMVNLFDSTTTKKIVIFLNLEDETLIQHNPLHEESIRIAAGLCDRLLSKGYPIRLISNGRDTVTNELTPVFSAGGTAALHEIMRGLSRIDLNKEREEFYPYIKRERENPEFRSAGYILISTSMKQPLQDEFALLTKEAPGIWVTPLYSNMNSHMKYTREYDTMRWEVEGHA